MSERMTWTRIFSSSLALCAAVLVVDSIRPAQAQILGGAVRGAIIGGILGGDDGAETGAILGGIGGAVRMSERRQEERRRREMYERQEMERRRQMEQERLRLERERNEMMRQRQAAETAVATQSADSRLIQRIQSALILMGFEIGVSDGRMSDATAEAIRAYQQNHGLLGTGAPSAELLEHMKQNL
jgi:hypothetical protein